MAVRCDSWYSRVKGCSALQIAFTLLFFNFSNLLKFSLQIIFWTEEFYFCLTFIKSMQMYVLNHYKPLKADILDVAIISNSQCGLLIFLMQLNCDWSGLCLFLVHHKGCRRVSQTPQKYLNLDRELFRRSIKGGPLS